jgi:endonuclease/exonuclease/phosphatase (EEP) superfamily protein YafD
VTPPRRHAFAYWCRRQLHRDGESRWWVAAVLLGWAALLAALGGLVAHLLDTSWQPLVVLAALAYQLMWGAPVALLLLAVARRWRAGAAALLALVLGAAVQAPLYLGRATPSGAPLTVLQANLRIGSADPAALVRLVERRHVDVLATEELTPQERDRLLAAGLTRLLPYRFDAARPDDASGLAIWSSYPLTRKVSHDGFQNGVLSAQVSVHGRSISLFAVHLQPPYPFPPGEWITELDRLSGLLATATRDTGSVLVAGDFNATTDHAQFRALLRNGYGDAAREIGAGYLPTYPADRWFPPVLAIDHVLTSGLAPTDVATVALTGSDHRGLLVRLSV